MEFHRLGEVAGYLRGGRWYRTQAKEWQKAKAGRKEHARRHRHLKDCGVKRTGAISAD